MGQIETLEQLRAEITLLKLKKEEQELYFIEKKNQVKNVFTSPLSFVKNVSSFLGITGGSSLGKNENKGSIAADWFTSLARVVVPFALNHTLLRGKGKIVKSLIALVSQKAISPAIFNQSQVTSFIDKATDWINSTIKRKKNKDEDEDYGIPPYSETS